MFIVFNACDWLREHISFTRLISANHKQASKTIYGHHDWLIGRLFLWITILKSCTLGKVIFEDSRQNTLTWSLERNYKTYVTPEIGKYAYAYIIIYFISQSCSCVN